MAAMAICASMPASAASPLETVSVIVKTSDAVDYFAPALAVTSQDVAVLPSETPNLQPAPFGRSSAGNASPSFASTTIDVAAYQHIDPDIAG